MDLNELIACDLLPVASQEGAAAETELGEEVLRTLEEEPKPLSCTDTSVVSAAPSPLASGSAVTALLSAFRRVENCLTSTQLQKCLPLSSPAPSLEQSAGNQSQAAGQVTPSDSARRSAMLREKAELEQRLKNLEASYSDLSETPNTQPDRRVTSRTSHDSRPDRWDCAEDSDTSQDYRYHHRRRYGRRSRRRSSDDSDWEEGTRGKKHCRRGCCSSSRWKRSRHCADGYPVKRQAGPPSPHAKYARSAREAWDDRARGSSQARRYSPSPDHAVYASQRECRDSQQHQKSGPHHHASPREDLPADSEDHHHASDNTLSLTHTEKEADSLITASGKHDHLHHQPSCEEEEGEDEDFVKVGEMRLERTESLGAKRDDGRKESAGVVNTQQSCSGKKVSARQARLERREASKEGNVCGDEGGKDLRSSIKPDGKISTEELNQEFYTAMVAGKQAVMMECLFRAVDSMRDDVMTSLSALREEMAELRWAVSRSTKMAAQNQQGQGQASSSSQNMTHAEMPEDFTFPLSTLEEVAELEERLIDADFKANLVRALSLVGGDNLKAVVNHVMKIVMTSSLARNYGYHGKHGKLCFRDLALRRVVFEAVRNTIPDATDYDMFKRVSLWLTASKDRDGGRYQRGKLPGRKDAE